MNHSFRGFYVKTQRIETDTREMSRHHKRHKYALAKTHARKTRSRQRTNAKHMIFFMYIIQDYARIHGSSKSILVTAWTSWEALAGISGHQAMILTLGNAVFDKKLLRLSFPHFSRADDISTTDVLTFHFSVFENSKCDINELWIRFKNIIYDCITSSIV